MADRAAVLQQVLDSKLIAVVRYDDPKPLIRALHAVVEGGVSAIEVTLTVPNALQVISEAQRELGNRVLIGAGTVLEVDTAKAALDAGASFIVSPVTQPEVINFCAMTEVAVMPGAFTPTEIVAAWNAGADIVRVFPADCLGPSFFQAVHNPFPKIRLMPTGGVRLATARSFLDAGAVCLGVGSQLVDRNLVDQGNLDALRDRSRQFVQVVDDFKKNRPLAQA